MKIYCEKCGLFIAEIKDKDNMHFKARKGITIDNGILILNCKCGNITKINTKDCIKKDGD